MKRVFASGGRAVVREVPPPELRRGEVLIETAFSAISVGTEMWLIDGSGDPTFLNHEYPPDPPSWPKTRTPVRREDPLPRPPSQDGIAIGYSLSGRVLAVDEHVTDIRPGDRVAASGSQCAHHAEIVAVPRNLVARVPDDVGLDDAALVTLGCIAVTALRATECHFGETIVLYGLGLLGLLATQVGRAAGFRIVGIDIDPARIELARRLGADVAIDSRSVDATAAVLEATDGFGADGVILGVKSDSSEPLNQSFDMCRQGATVVAQGLFPWEIDRSRFYANQARLVPAIGYGLGRYDPVYEEANEDYPIGIGRWTENRNQEYFLRLLADGAIDTASLAPTQVPIGHAEDAYEMLRRPDRPPTVVIRYGGEG